MELRQAREREVDLGEDAAHPVVLDLVAERWRQPHRIDEAEQGPPRVGVRDHDAGPDLFAGGQRDAAHPAVIHIDLDDVRVAADLGARAGRRRREGTGQRAGSSRDERGRAGRMPFVRHLQEPRGCGPRRPWTRRGAEDPATADDRARDRRLEPLGGEIGDRHRPPSQHLVNRDRPSPRIARPVVTRSHSSPGPGSSSEGGTCRRSPPIAPAIATAVSENSGQRAASAADQRASDCTLCNTSRHSTRALPSPAGANTLTGGRMRCRPCFSRFSSETMSVRNATACASAGTRKPGASSSVTAAPPTSSRRSSTRGLRPARAR